MRELQNAKGLRYVLSAVKCPPRTVEHGERSRIRKNSESKLLRRAVASYLHAHATFGTGHVLATRATLAKHALLGLLIERMTAKSGEESLPDADSSFHD